MASKDKSKTNGIPEHLIPEVTQAVLEDAVLTAAADLAATLSEQYGDEPAEFEETVVLIAETPEQIALVGLDGVPFLGPVRRQALEEAGILNREHLMAATQEEIGGVKGVGMRNAERIKEWLALQEAVNAQPAVTTEATSVAILDPEQALENQTIYDDLGTIETNVARIVAANRKKGLDKKVQRQMDRVLLTIAEVPEALDSISREDARLVTSSLNQIALLLDVVADRGRLSEKKQDLFRSQLKGYRQHLEKILGT